MPMSSWAAAMPAMMMVAATSAHTMAFALRMVRSVVMTVGPLFNDDDQEQDYVRQDGGCGEPDKEPAEPHEVVADLLDSGGVQVELLVQVRLLGVKLLGVAAELGERLALVLAGALQDSDCALGLGQLAFVLDDALHCESDVGVEVLRVLVVPEVDMVGSAAVLADFVLEARDAVVEAVDVGAYLVVVVDDCLDGGVAVVASCCAVALSLGVRGGHGVCPS